MQKEVEEILSGLPGYTPETEAERLQRELATERKDRHGERSGWIVACAAILIFAVMFWYKSYQQGQHIDRLHELIEKGGNESLKTEVYSYEKSQR